MADIKISARSTASVLTGAETVGIIQTALDRKTTTQAIANLAVPYKSFVAILSQSGTAAPTASVLLNTIGGTPAYARLGAGQFSITLTGLLTVNKTIAFTSNSTIGRHLQAYALDVNRVELDQCDSSDTPQDALFLQVIEIRVYP